MTKWLDIDQEIKLILDYLNTASTYDPVYVDAIKTFNIAVELQNRLSKPL